MDAEEYARDFQSEASKQDFRYLLARARDNDRWQAPDGLEREEAYERAGRYVVDRCDALIAVWDGEQSRGRGGTAEIVGYAQKQGVPIAWVHTKGDLPVRYALENSRAEVVQAAARKLRKYNTTRIAPWRVRRQERRLRAEPDAGHDQDNTHRPARPVPGGGGQLGIPVFHPRGHPGAALSAPVPVAQPGYFRAGRLRRGGRGRAGVSLQRRGLGGLRRGCQPPDPAAHPLDEPPVAHARPVDLQSLPGRTTALELFPRAGRDGRPEGRRHGSRISRIRPRPGSNGR